MLTGVCCDSLLGVPRMLDERGAAVRCSALMPETAELVAARAEGIA